MNTKVFLDLEETVITNWSEELLHHPERVKRFLDSIPGFDRTVEIFSFAIGNQRDKDLFVSRKMKEMLERELNVDIVAWPSVEEMARASQKFTGCRWLFNDECPSGLDLTEFISIKGKVGAFDDFCMLNHPKDTHCILIDDIVPDRITKFWRDNLIIELVNVDRLP